MFTENDADDVSVLDDEEPVETVAESVDCLGAAVLFQPKPDEPPPGPSIRSLLPLVICFTSVIFFTMFICVGF